MQTINTSQAADTKHNEMLATVKRLSKYNKEHSSIRVIRAATLILTEAMERSKADNHNAVSIDQINARLRNAYVGLGKDVPHGLTIGFIRTLVNNVQMNAKARAQAAADQFKCNSANHEMILKHAEKAAEWKRAQAVVIACEGFVAVYDATISK